MAGSSNDSHRKGQEYAAAETAQNHMNHQQMIDSCLRQVQDPSKTDFERRVWREFAVQAYGFFQLHYHQELTRAMELDLGAAKVHNVLEPISSLGEMANRFNALVHQCNDRFGSGGRYQRAASAGPAREKDGDDWKNWTWQKGQWSGQNWVDARWTEHSASSGEPVGEPVGEVKLDRKGCLEIFLWNHIVICFQLIVNPH